MFLSTYASKLAIRLTNFNFSFPCTFLFMSLYKVIEKKVLIKENNKYFKIISKVYDIDGNSKIAGFC